MIERPRIDERGADLSILPPKKPAKVVPTDLADWMKRHPHRLAKMVNGREIVAYGETLAQARERLSAAVKKCSGIDLTVRSNQMQQQSALANAKRKKRIGK